MQCWVCHRQARGFGQSDTRFPVANPRRYPLDWVFCSSRCQEAFHRLYGNWFSDRREGKEAAMLDASEVERAAMKKCLKFFGEAADEIGFDKPLGAYTEAEALQVIDAIVTGYTEAMVEHHEATRYPPIRSKPGVPARLLEKKPASSAEPFNDPIPF
jgi:hypothetical protein